jgi:hypothetical protein
MFDDSATEISSVVPIVVGRPYGADMGRFAPGETPPTGG